MRLLPIIPIVGLLLVVVAGTGCRKREAPVPDTLTSTSAAAKSDSVAVASAIAAAVEASQPKKPEYDWYGWLAEANQLGLPPAGELLRDRIPLDGPDYSQSAVELGTFAEWLRFIPVMPRGTPVRSGDGEIVLAAGDPQVAAVIEMASDRECRFRSVFLPYRLHAEWLWTTGERRFSFKTAAGEDLPLVAWARGERPQIRAGKVYFSRDAAPNRQLLHSDLRDYLTGISPFLDVGALVQHSRVVKPDEVKAGDVFVHGSPPGDAVVVFDVAVHRGTKAKSLLLGRVLDPCSSVYILRASEKTNWFVVDPSHPLTVPGTLPFHWSELRRLRVYGFNPDRR